VRANVVVFGVALVLVGFVVWYFPLTTGSTSAPVPRGDAYDYGLPGALLIGPIPYTASWTASGPANITIYSCGTDPGCPDGPDAPVVAYSDEASGSLSWTSSGGHFFLLVPGAPVNVTVTYMEPIGGGLVGIGVLGFGVIITVAGLAMRRRSPPSALPAPQD
jgi:hypothetical protein